MTNPSDRGQNSTTSGQGGTTQWRGLHVLIDTNADMEALHATVPALAQQGLTVLIPEVAYNYDFRSLPELRSANPVTFEQARALSATCRQHGIRVIPEINSLGHQSWKEQTHALLAQYPQFDETPGQYPNNEGIYCRSWCPLHPEVNAVVFALYDELLDAFQADAFHVGMDEVGLLGSEHCPRCRGQDPALLYAQAVNDIHAHLVGRRGVEMLMWGDRLLSSAETGYDEWESAVNQTHQALDRIPTDIVICDWHYTPREHYPSLKIFLDKGFRVWPSVWRDEQAIRAFIGFASRHRHERLLGVLSTSWGEVKPGELASWSPFRTAMEQAKLL